MKHIFIEWKHFDKNGNTCIRCSKTGLAIQKAVDKLKDNLKKNGINIRLKETKIPEKEIQASNSILINGIPIENLLGKTKKIETPCDSCCELIGSSVNCRALKCQGRIREDISAGLIKNAVINLLKSSTINK